MQTFIIVNNDFKFISRMVNLIYPIKDVKIKSLFCSYDNNLRSTFIDFSNVYIISEDLYCKYYSKFPKTIKCIVFVNNPTHAKTNNNTLYISTKTSDASLRKSITSFIKGEISNSVENRLQKLLNSFRFDFTLNGTRYLYESILYCLGSDADYLCENLHQNVFFEVSKRYNTSANNIKWSIARSINRACKRMSKTDYKRLKKYFKLEDDQPPTPKRIICTIINKFYKKN